MKNGNLIIKIVYVTWKFLQVLRSLCTWTVLITTFLTRTPFFVTVVKVIPVLTMFNYDSMFMHVCVLVFMESPLATTFGSDFTWRQKRGGGEDFEILTPAPPLRHKFSSNPQSQINITYLFFSTFKQSSSSSSSLSASLPLSSLQAATNHKQHQLLLLLLRWRLRKRQQNNNKNKINHLSAKKNFSSFTEAN